MTPESAPLVAAKQKIPTKFTAVRGGGIYVALITTGLTKNGAGIEGKTAHFQFSYDDSFAGPGGIEPARTNAVIAACENDYNWLSGLFGGGISITGIDIQVTTQAADPCSYGAGGIGACWNGSQTSSTIKLITSGLSYSNNPAYIRYLIILELSEIFMMVQNIGWFQGTNEGSKGEGLSIFLASQFLVQNGLLGLGPENNFAEAANWLNSTRKDYINNAPDDTSTHEVRGCTVLFIYYLFHQLGFSINQIIAAGAATLAGVYNKLTGDSGDPFPFFERLLDFKFPSQSGNAVSGPNKDDPWPIGILSFVMDKNSFGKDEVNDAIGSAGNGLFSNAFWLSLEGFNRQAVGGLTASLSGPATALTGVTLPPDPDGVEYERPLDLLAPQRIRFPFDVKFASSSLTLFPAKGNPPVEELLNGSITVLGTTFGAATLLQLLYGADPYLANVDPSQGNVNWLSQDLRVFTATPSVNNTPVPGSPPFGADSFDGAYAYIQALLGYLNASFNNPAGIDPFNPASNVIPQQSGAYTGDSSVTPSTNSHKDYNFAVARVRMRGPQGSAGEAQNTRVFFRLWSTQTADTDFQSSTYPSHTDAAGLPDWPQPAADSHTFPFFATGNAPNLNDPNNPEYGTNGVNNKTILNLTGDQVWAYYGCFLNVYDPANVINGQPVQNLLNGTHHCLVAQIAYDGAPIVNANGVTESPGNSDKLAQRNLQVTASDNPGPPSTHVIPQTFDLRPSLAPILGQDVLLQYPDELMIDWGNTPVGSKASIYWPQANASQILQTASRLYASHLLSAADANTIQCQVTGGITYVPIPSGASQNLAGLLTIDLPQTVVTGQEFNIVLRRLVTRRLIEPPPPRIASREVLTAIRGDHARAALPMNWRYVAGTFQVKIPVATATSMLPQEEDTLAIFKWRLGAMSPSNRWYPVLNRYIGYIEGRVRGLGGDPDKIPPSPDGAPHKHEPPRDRLIEHTGKVSEVVYDCFGDFEGFVLCDCDEPQKFSTREPAIEKIALRACRRRLWLSVFVGRHDRKIRKLIIRC
jgi:hypothetical protein